MYTILGVALLACIIAVLLMIGLAPEGYEDETGWHRGRQ